MTKEVRSYRDLVAWQKGMELVGEIYRISRDFPKDEIFGLVSQMRRAAVSIPSNIAEGHQKLSRKEYQHFLGNARGSLAEIETQILIAKDLDYLGEIEMNRILNLSAELGRVLNGLINSIRKKQ
ncbi:MAG: four helix bundle protein [Desulfobaccales bacterium]